MEKILGQGGEKVVSTRLEPTQNFLILLRHVPVRMKSDYIGYLVRGWKASSFDAASASKEIETCILWWVAGRAAGKLMYEKEQISAETENYEAEPRYYRLVAWGKPLARETAESTSPAFPFFSILPQIFYFTDAVYDIAKKIYGRPSDNPMEYPDVIVAKWWVIKNEWMPLKASVHLRNDHDVNLRHVNNFLELYITIFRRGRSVVSKRLLASAWITMNSRRISTTLLQSRADENPNAKVYVFSDSWKAGSSSSQCWPTSYGM